MTYKLNYVKYRSPKNGGFWNAYAGAAFNDKGGEPPFAAVCTDGSFAQLVYFAKSRGQPKLDRHHRINMLRCSPSKQTLAHERSILACWMTASQDLSDLRCKCANVGFGEPFNKRSFLRGFR